MGDLVGAVIGIVVLMFTLGGGLAVQEVYSARTELSQITTMAAEQMAVDGGYTQQVQDTLISELQNANYNPAMAQVTVNPNQPDNYGDVFTITIKYPVAVAIAGEAPFTTTVTTYQSEVSLYPCSNGSCSANNITPGQGTTDLQNPNP